MSCHWGQIYSSIFVSAVQKLFLQKAIWLVLVERCKFQSSMNLSCLEQRLHSGSAPSQSTLMLKLPSLWTVAMMLQQLPAQGRPEPWWFLHFLTNLLSILDPQCVICTLLHCCKHWCERCQTNYLHTGHENLSTTVVRNLEREDNWNINVATQVKQKNSSNHLLKSPN